MYLFMSDAKLVVPGIPLLKYPKNDDAPALIMYCPISIADVESCGSGTKYAENAAGEGVGVGVGVPVGVAVGDAPGVADTDGVIDGVGVGDEVTVGVTVGVGVGVGLGGVPKHMVTPAIIWVLV
jgi:hypothetical protein